MWNVFVVCLLYVFIKHLKPNQKKWKKLRYLSLKEPVTSYDQWLVSTYNLRQCVISEYYFQKFISGG